MLPNTPSRRRPTIRRMPTQQRSTSAPAPDITLNSCSCGQPKLATEPSCPSCAYEQDFMKQAEYGHMLKAVNDPEARQTLAGTRCHCGRRKPAYRLRCSACDDRRALLHADLPPIVSLIERPNDATKLPCPKCGHPRHHKYVYCRKCSKAVDYLLHNGDISAYITLNKCACGRPKHPAFSQCTKCYANHPNR